MALALSQNDSSVKCHMGDTGLLATMAFGAVICISHELCKKFLNDQLGVNEVTPFENAVAQSVASSGNGLYFCAHRLEKTH